MTDTQPDSAGRIAIIGMAGRFPGARDVREFWENLKAGIESITRFTADELEVPDRARLTALDNYVPARAIVAGVDQFDAAFFGIMPREADLLDPQHRLFLECCWHAFDDAGYDPLNCSAPVGVYAGSSYNSYFLEHVGAGQAFFDDYAAGYQVSNFNTMLASNAEFLATRVAYKLNLRGPAFSLGAGCATSLVAVSQACLALQNYQCDMALAGAVSITFPQRRGYLHEPGGIVSADGHCRSFDAAADGTVFGDGVGAVLLKRLEDAVADGDHIYAVILGCGINNDGSNKVGFTAPSVEGQALAIEMAHAAAGVDPATITYVEAHGTGTALGDPVEVAALTRAFRRRTDRKNFCALGTAKTNVGHLDVAAGIAGLIKTAMSLHHRIRVPLLHFQRANPRLDLENTPFYVQRELQDWIPGTTPLRAGVSAFGMGGTNTHLVLEQAPDASPSPSRWTRHLLILSARTEPALDRSAANLAGYLAGHQQLDPADVAFTLMNGRHCFDARRIAVCANLRDASAEFTETTRDKTTSGVARGPAPPVAFMFPGQGSQYVGMGRRLRALNPVFRDQFDRCAEIVRDHGGPDLHALIYPAADSAAGQRHRRHRMRPARYLRRRVRARADVAEPRHRARDDARTQRRRIRRRVPCRRDDPRRRARTHRRARPPDGRAAARRDALRPPRRTARPRFARRHPLGRRRQLADAHRRRRSLRRHRTLRTNSRRRLGRMPPPGHLARVPLPDDGTDRLRVPRRLRPHLVFRAAHPVHLERHRRLDFRARRDQSRLLGAPSARARPLLRRRRPPARRILLDPRSRSRHDAHHARAPASRDESIGRVDSTDNQLDARRVCRFRSRY